MKHPVLNLALSASLLLTSVAIAQANTTVELTDAQMENLVLRSYQYVAMFNVNNKGALDVNNPMSTGGYNKVYAATALTDHTLRVIARPNNDTLYTIGMIDVTEEPIVMKIPAFDSTYVSLMVTGYDHYVNIPMSTSMGADAFAEPTTILFYSERTPGYGGEPVEGVDRIFEATGDFLSAVLRVMPHAAEPERLEANRNAMQTVTVETLSEFLGQSDDEEHFAPWDSPPGVNRNLDLAEDTARFPPFGSDFEIFEDQFIEVMQFVVNHTTFDAQDEMDVELLAALKPLGIVPGKTYDPDAAPEIDGAELRAVAQRVARESLARFSDAAWVSENGGGLFLPKGKMPLDRMVAQSVAGPIGQPASQALYSQIITEDGAPMNAMYDYEIVMAAEDMPPAKAFWSLTLYDTANGFFIPNERFKYSVGENAGFQLDGDGGIRIVIAAEQPAGVPEENWLPITREDLDLDIMMRIYAPDLARFATWTPPVARRID